MNYDYSSLNTLKSFLRFCKNTFAAKLHNHTKSDIYDFPINISEFNNDSKFLTIDDIGDKELTLKYKSNTTIYHNPKSIVLNNAMQIIFYAASGGKFTLDVGSEKGDLFEYNLENSDSVGWFIWIQSGSIDGSFISQTYRQYFIMNRIATSAEVNFQSSIEGYNPAYIVITIE